MYLILDNADTIRNITDGVLYVKTLQNGCTIVTTPEEGVAVHSDSGDSFWRLKSGSPGDELFHVVEVQTLPAGVQTDVWKYIGGEVVASKESLAASVREQRTKLLKKYDWTQALDAAISPESREALRVYRQALRDIPEQAGFPETVTFPTPPVITKALPDPVDVAFDTLTGGTKNA